ncbi:MULTISPECIES: YhdP family protein [unclassified Thioalkalivibrio]|uniref:YhdP family protein n=1 Tax=unclassified Thioalkalivibrio TaxID=2621013 RepID=UPI0003824D97|nr:MULTISPECIES: YhdP family protein [unclassified Thioalkalivibrio]
MLVPALLVVILLLMLVLLGLRLCLPHWDGLHERLETAASETSGMQVRAESVELGWRGWTPELVVRGVQMVDGDAEPLEVERVGATLDPVASLRAWAPRLRLQVIGMEARLVRQADGRVTFHGHTMGTGEGAVLEHALEAWPEFDGEAISLVWEDRVAGITSAARLERLSFRSAADGDGLLRLAGALDPEAAGSFELGVRIPASAARDARFFLEGQSLEIAHWAPWLAYLGLPAIDGTSGARIWGDLEDGRLTRLRGFHTTRLNGDEDARERELGHRFDWHVDDAWHRSAWTGTRPGSGDLRMRYRLETGAHGAVVDRLELAARGLDAEVYAPFKPLLDHAAPALADPVARLRPRGRLADGTLVARRDDDRLRIREAELDLRSFSLRTDGDWPGVRGLDLRAWWDAETDEAGATFDGEHLRAEFPRLLGDEILWLDRLRGELHARRHAPDDWTVAGEGLEVRAEQGAASLRGELRLDGHEQGPLLAMAMDIHHADGAYAARYLPERYLPATTYQWLARSIVDGRGTGGGMAYRGRPREFPFADHQGVFDLWADIEDGVLDYQEGWPPAEELAGRLWFRNEAFRTEGARARILDTRITRGDVTVTDMTGEPDLELDASADSNAADLLAYLRRAGLGDELAELRDGAEAAGPAGLDLQLLLPLDSDRMDDLRVAGRLRPQGLDLNVPQWPVALDGLRGEIRFDTADRVHAEGLEAGVHGERVALDIDWPLDGERARLGLRGPQPIEPWLEGIPELAAHASGRAHWDAELSLGGGIDGMRLDLRSDLEGVAIDWPDPLGKAEDQRRDLTVSLPLDNRRPAVGELGLGDVLHARLRLLPQDEQRPALQALALGLGRTAGDPPGLPSQGAVVEGHFAELDAGAWARALQAAPWAGNVQVAGPGTDAPEEAVTGVPLNRVVLRVDEALHWDDLSVPATRLRAVRDPGGWQVESRSDWLAGTLGWRHGLSDRRDHLQLELEQVHLPELELGGPDADSPPEETPAAEGVSDPRNWPSVRLALDSLRLGDYRFADIRGDLIPDADGLALRDLVLRSPEPGIRAAGRGGWHVDAGGRGRSRLELDLEGDDWGQGLDSSGLTRALRGGDGTAEVQLEWPGALFRPSLARLQGAMELTLSDGELADVEPGAGRLLGLVSLDLLPQRLRLDFRDLFVEGLAFSELQGNARLADGVLHVPELGLETASAAIRVRGDTNLVAREYDQEIVVVPRLRTALPIAGALLGGPVTGAAVLLLERVLGIGDQMEEAARVEYRVTGPWERPRVETRVEPAED